MKHIIPLILILALPVLSHAQRIHAYVTSGVTLAQIEGDELKGFLHPGAVAGVGALAALDDRYRYGLSVEAIFNQRGTHSSSSNPYRTHLTLNYVDSPLLFHYQDPYGGMLFGLGAVYSRLVRQPHGKLQYHPAAFIPDTTDMTFLSNDLSLLADLRFTIWKGLQFNLRYQHSIIPIKRDWHFTEVVGQVKHEIYRNAYNQSISLRLIWQF